MPLSEKVKYDPVVIDQILTEYAALGEDQRERAAYLRTFILQATNDPVISLLTRSYERQADAFEALATATENNGDKLNKTLSTELAAVRTQGGRQFYMMVVVVILVVFVLAGMVGLNLRLDADKKQIEVSPHAQSLPGVMDPEAALDSDAPLGTGAMLFLE